MLINESKNIKHCDLHKTPFNSKHHFKEQTKKHHSESSYAIYLQNSSIRKTLLGGGGGRERVSKNVFLHIADIVTS